VRQQELETLKDRLQPPAEGSGKLLEIGGGNGFGAKCLAEMGFEVVSIDPKPCEPSHFPVQAGDARDLQFADNSFDVIFSANVLEHVTDLAAALAEMKRVLRPGGLMVHTMPTAFCTKLSMLTQPVGYVFALGDVLRRAARSSVSAFSACHRPASVKHLEGDKVRQRRPAKRHKFTSAMKIINPLRLIITPAHGTSPSCFAELREWAPQAWRKKFEQAGLCVREIVNLPLAYSRHVIFPFHFVSVRRRLAQAGKTSCMACVLQSRGA